MDNDEQMYLDQTELRTALNYQDIVESYGLQNTLFVTGKAVAEEPEIAERLASSANLELGGHTWAAFRPRILHRLFGAVGHTYGPRWFQALDIRRTCKRLNEITDHAIKSWRTHAYLSNANTRNILGEQGIKVISDTVTPNEVRATPTDVNGLTSLPINTLPDHEHIYHGSRTKTTAQESGDDWSDEFTSKSFEIDEWLHQVKEQIRAIERNDGIATIMAHPSCMSIADDFDVFDRLCAWIVAEDFGTGCCGDVVKH